MNNNETLIYMTQIYSLSTGTLVRLSVLHGALPEPITPWE